MDQFDIDNKFKESLFGHKTAIDKDALWAAIEQKQNRRFGGWLIFGAFALLAFVSILGIRVMDSFSVITNDDQVAHFTSTTSQPNLIVQHTANSDQHKVAQEVTAVSENEQANRTKHKNIIATNRSKKTQPILQTKDEPITDNYQPTILSQSNTNELTSTVADLENQKYKKSDNSTKAPIANAPTKLSTLQRLSKKKTALLKKEENEINRNKNIKCYDHSNSQLELSVIAYGSVDYVFNRFSADQDQLTYREERDATQTQLEGYRTGLQLKLLTTVGFYAKGGIELGIIHERFDTEITETTTEIRPNQLLDVIEGPDTTIFIFGDAPFTINRSTTYEIFNSYRTLGIPFSLGYQVATRDYFYGFEVGGIYDFTYNFSGTLLDTSLQPNSNLRDYFINSNLTSLTGGFHVGYKWKERISLMASCSFKHNLANINNGDNTLNQSNTRIGLGLGLEYQL